MFWAFGSGGVLASDGASGSVNTDSRGDRLVDEGLQGREAQGSRACPRSGADPGRYGAAGSRRAAPGCAGRAEFPGV